MDDIYSSGLGAELLKDQYEKFLAMAGSVEDDMTQALRRKPKPSKKVKKEAS